MTESNGRIKLTWQQIVWAISLISAIVLSWADLRTMKSDVSEIKSKLTQVYTKTEVDNMKKIYEDELTKRDKKIKRLERRLHIAED